MSGTTNGRVKWKLSRLKEHPRQAAMFGDLSDEELNALAEDMDKHGQRDPIEVLPDGTILAGHQRARAARLLGWKEVEVVIRRDFENDSAAAEAHLIGDNLIRRHLSPLARARCLRRLMEIESGGRSGYLDWSKKEQLKELLGNRLNLSLRSVNRYLLVLEALPEVQAAFDRGDVTLIQAGKVALLDRREQQDVARRIKEGERAKDVVAHALSGSQGSSDDPGRSLVRLVGAIKRETGLLQGHENELRPGRLKNSLPILRQGAALLEGLIARAARAS